MTEVRVFYSDGEACDDCRGVGPGKSACDCLEEGWYWQGDPSEPPEGPFETEAEALADAGAEQS